MGHERMKLMPDDKNRLQPLESRAEPFGICDENGNTLFDICNSFVSDIDLFATELVEHTPATYIDSFGTDLKRWPDASKLPRASEILLSPGEMLVLPESWWMQCYF